jgi:membrane peptidoglycan carboxypeptidase
MHRGRIVHAQWLVDAHCPRIPLHVFLFDRCGSPARNAAAHKWLHLRPVAALRGQADRPRASVIALSAGAAYLVRQALTIRDRPDFPERKRFTGAPPGVAWKTGTSYGHRDAWAAGWLGTLTAVVWMGNVDNSPSVSLVGTESSRPRRTRPSRASRRACRGT